MSKSKLSPGKTGSHFLPSSDLFSSKEKSDVIVSTTCWCIMISLLVALACVFGPVPGGRRVERRPRVRRESRRALAAGDVRRGGGSDAGEGETAVAGTAGAEEGVGGQRQATRPRRWRRRCRRRGGGDCRHGLALLDEFP
uniref:Uncharacterized protein n=1 Tax=Oryza nivara TaxID=4536 RepID=A0A0E0IXI4_ORYNI